MNSVCGSMHQADPLFKGCDTQCTVNVLMAFVTAQRKPAKDWDSHSIDKVLIRGDVLHSLISNDKPRCFMVDELPYEIMDQTGPCTFMYGEPITGSIFENEISDPQSPFRNLEVLCEISLENNFAFLVFGNKIPAYTVGIIFEGSSVFLFDPHSRDQNGMCAAQGTALLTEHTIDSVVHFIRALVLSLNLPVDCPFELVPVSIGTSNRCTADSDTDSSFSGFEEVADTDVKNNYHESTDDSDSDNIPLAVLKQLYKEEFNTDDDIPLAESCFRSSDDSSGTEYSFSKSELRQLAADVSTSEQSLSDSETGAPKSFKKRKFRRAKMVQNDKTPEHSYCFSNKIPPCTGDEESCMTENTVATVQSNLDLDKNDIVIPVTSSDNVANFTETWESNVTEETASAVLRSDEILMLLNGGISSDGPMFCEDNMAEYQVFDLIANDVNAEGDFTVVNLTVGNLNVDSQNDSLETTVWGNISDDYAGVQAEVGINSSECREENMNVPHENMPSDAEAGDTELRNMPCDTEHENMPCDTEHENMPCDTGPGDTELGNMPCDTEHGNTRNSSSNRQSRSSKTNPKKKGRKRQRDSDNWERNIAQRMRNTGKSFTTIKGTVRSSRLMRGGCGPGCKFQCHKAINEQEREKIFYSFWALGDITRQRDFILKHCLSKHAARRPVDNNKRKKSFTYHFVDGEVIQRVCKTFFMDTLDISDTMIYTAHKNSDSSGIASPDMRGKHSSRPNKTAPHTLDMIRKHINSFPHVESHYCRKNTNKLYLASNLSLSKIYQLFVAKCGEENQTPPSLGIYRNVFKSEFNLGFHRPKKDLCDLCTTFKNSSDQEKKNMYEKYETHIKNKENARSSKEYDRTRAQNSGSTVAACFDLEQVLPTPKSFESCLYYKRKLNTLNFTVYNLGNSDGYSYIWNESVAGRGAYEIASCVLNFIQGQCQQGKDHFIFYSDNCSAQNKNTFYISMLWYALQKYSLSCLEHKYLEKGHTQNENDTLHSCIESVSRNISVSTTPQWASTVRLARPKQPIKVMEMNMNEFYNFKELSKNIKNFDLDENRDNVYWASVRTLKLESSSPNVVMFQYDYGGPYHKINLAQRLRRNSSEPPNPCSIQLNQLRYAQIPITKDKYEDLMYLCSTNIVPSVHHEFFKKLTFAG